MNWNFSVYLWGNPNCMQGYTHHLFPGFGDRYVAPESFESALGDFKDVASLISIGESVMGRPIYGLQLGAGSTRVLMWSQMHGNESTTTRALLDLLLAYKQDDTIRELLDGFSLYLIPMLNPDGAHAYTRNNASDIDLNRDAQDRTQPETQVLFSVIESFKPQYCLNLHDQRSRYGLGDPPVPATLSFLAPAEDEERSITPARRTAMLLIGEVAIQLQKQNELHIGRYDDTFNINCVGDTVTASGIPTILIEAGFYPGDYSREKTREYVFYAICNVLKQLNMVDLTQNSVESYFDLPENHTCYVDIHIKNAFPERSEDKHDLYLNYEEKLQDGKIEFVPALLEEEYATSYIGHAVYDFSVQSDKDRILAEPALRHFFE